MLHNIVEVEYIPIPDQDISVLMMPDIIETEYTSIKDFVLTKDIENPIKYHRVENGYYKCESLCRHNNLILDAIAENIDHDIAKIMYEYIPENEKTEIIQIDTNRIDNIINITTSGSNETFQVGINNISNMKLCLYYTIYLI